MLRTSNPGSIISLLLFISIFQILPSDVYGQRVISGTVTDAKTGESLIGANVIIKGTTQGTQTDISGKFSLTVDELPVSLNISFLGYITLEVPADSEDELNIRLSTDKVLLKDVEVVGSRISEKERQAPLTVESMDVIAIRETPAASFYEGLGQLKGVDLTSASIGFKIINTRGFNSTSPVRTLQIIDGVDNASPGLNFSLGNFLGAAELDVNKVDLVVGASSAYYGPNAFNGVISMTTRDPFLTPGLEVMFKVGTRNMLENGIRFADVIKNKDGKDKFAYKFNIYYLNVDDWEADNLTATPQSRSDIDNPGGYDAVNIYGDEFQNGFDQSQSAFQFPGFGVIYRKGYREKDLVDYNTENLKLGAAFHYRITDKTELILASNYGTGSTIYQGDNRYSLRDIKFYQNRIEIRQKDKWFLRAYATNEDAGNSYDAFFTALLLQESAKSNSKWYRDYENYWNINVKNNLTSLPGYPVYDPNTQTFEEFVNSINPFLYNNYYDTLVYYHNTTQAFANGVGFLPTTAVPFLEPGTFEFDTAFASITSRRSFSQGGSRFYDKSALYHLHGEYKFTPEFMDIVIGANTRMYRPESDGTIFSDTSGTVIENNEYGVYTGLEKFVMDRKLKLNLTARLDKNENFDYLFSPALSAVYLPDEKQVVRLSVSSAIRNPTLADQYLYYPVGRAILIGNKDGYKDLVTIESLINFYDFNSKFDTLEFFDVAPVQPEEVKTLELGYRNSFSNRLYLDVSGYYSWYDNFIGYKLGADVDTLTTPTAGKILKFNNAVRVATNSLDQVNTYGVSIGLNYYVGRYYALTSNYSWNVLDRQGSDDPLIPAFNTPEHKINIGFNGRDIGNFGFNVNYKWVDGYQFEGSPQFTGYIESFGVVDAQVNYKVNNGRIMLKLGGSNILDNRHYEVYGGPLIGSLYYFSISLTVPSENL